METIRAVYESAQMVAQLNAVETLSFLVSMMHDEFARLTPAEQVEYETDVDGMLRNLEFGRFDT